MSQQRSKIDLHLHLSSPLYVAYPDNKDDRNVSRTVKKTVVVDGRPFSIPYFPGNGLRGGLRRMAAAYVMGSVGAKGTRIPAALYLGLTCGASSGSPDQSAVSVEELVRAKSNVYMGLFGGGARLLRSRYSASDINPVLKITRVANVVPASCEERIKPKPMKDGDSAPQFLQPWELLDVRTLIRVDDLYRVVRPEEIQNFVADPAQSVSNHQLAVLTNKDDRKEGATKSDVSNMMAIETVAEGTPMHCRIDLQPDLTDGQVGLLLQSLADLLNENAFGGFNRTGFGRAFVDSMTVSFHEETFGSPDLYDGDRFILPPAAQRYIDAAKQDISGLTLDEMEGYFIDFSAEKKAAKKAAEKTKKTATTAS